MNKTELIDAIAKSADLTKTDAGKAINGVTNAICEALSAGDSVTLFGFGTFSVSERAARTGEKSFDGERDQDCSQEGREV